MKFKIYILFCFVLTLSNCSRYFDWAQSTFTGGTKREICLSTREFICSSSIYDQFRTVGIFDVLWLNSTARSEFVKLRTCRDQLSPDRKQELISAQQIELDRQLTFYVLMPVLPVESLPVEPCSPAPWSVSLQVDNCRSYQPICIKPVDIEPEFAYLFDCYYLGESFIKFKRPYLVIFDACDDLREPVIKPESRCVKITISSIEYCTSCQWAVPQNRTITC